MADTASHAFFVPSSCQNFSGRISYKKMGNGKTPLLCLPGLGGNHFHFEFLIPYLQNHFDVVVVSPRGMTPSEEAHREYQLEDLALDAIDLMEHLDLKKYHVMGVSMGGFIAQIMALKAPEKINQLVLLCTSSSDSNFIPIHELNDEDFRNMDAFGVAGIKMSLSNLTHASLSKENFAKIFELRIANSQNVEQVILQNRAAKNFLKNKIELEKIENETLILTGACDRFVNPKNSYILGQKIKNSKVAQIPESDHYFFLEKPKEVSDELMTFLDRF